MTALREAIFAEIEQRLSAVAAEVERMPSGDPARFPALHIFDSDQDVGESDTGGTRYELPILVEGYVEASGGSAAHSALNALYAATVAALVTEPPLGGLAETIDETGMRVTVAALASTRRLAFALDLSITFSTARGDPTQPA